MRIGTLTSQPDGTSWTIQCDVCERRVLVNGVDTEEAARAVVDDNGWQVGHGCVACPNCASGAPHIPGD